MNKKILYLFGFLSLIAGIIIIYGCMNDGTKIGSEESGFFWQRDKKEINDKEEKKVETDEVRKNMDSILEEYRGLNDKNKIEFTPADYSPQIEGNDWFIYDETDKDIKKKEGHIFLLYKIVPNFKNETTRNQVVVKYKIDKNKANDISNMSILEYGDKIIGKVDRDIEKINSILNSKSKNISETIEYENENGQERIIIYENMIEYRVLEKAQKTEGIKFKEGL
ncbi:hypothetical protein M4I33_10150 [Clostridium sp. LY3-2]|uniref:hypothetical protein n=1 Tax=Clostridium sp. LY3-2 TaxID=2942482 RepID=UPI0021536EBC|nr:hypothetical protein [Clostridium sp. LY3-2]MCR6515229.1 hypothetical protein [Clostridium sp. LY3-2]